LEDLNLEMLKEKYPGYYAQQQEYMRMSGYRISILVFLEMGFPWDLTEIHIPFDPKFAYGVRDKYLRVREAANRGELPRACCSIGDKGISECPARGICPVAKDSGIG